MGAMARGGLARASGIAVAAAFVAITCAGCVANEPVTPARGVAVSGPPPDPIKEEQRPAPPSPQSAWVAGYWHWTGMHYAWIPGHWEQAPAGATWAAPKYVSRDGSYFYEPGTWSQPSRQNANAIR
jgi:hypothetical protein